MAASRLPMRQLRELLRLKYQVGLPQRAIAQACGIGLGTVSAYLQRAQAAGLTWPVPPDLEDRLAKHPRARRFFETLDSQNRYAILYRLHHATRPETRRRRLDQFVGMLEAGETIH